MPPKTAWSAGPPKHDPLAAKSINKVTPGGTVRVPVKATTTTAAASPSPQRVPRDEKNVVSFRIHHPVAEDPNGPSAAEFAARRTTTQAQSREKTIFRLKSIINECVDMCNHSGDLGYADDVINLLEEAVRDMKVAKQDVRTRRRAVTSSPDTPQKPKMERVTPPAAVEKVEKHAAAAAAETKAEPKPAAAAAAADDSAAGRSYASALKGVRAPPLRTFDPSTEAASTATPPPQNALCKSDSTCSAEKSPQARLTERVSVDRSLLASRSEERLLEAEEKRKAIVAEKQRKAQLSDERQVMAKVRREQETEKVKTHSTEKQERAAKNKEAIVAKTVEKAQMDIQRGEEIALVSKMSQAAKGLALNEKLEQSDHKAEELRQQQEKEAQLREENYNTVLERKRDMDQQKTESLQKKAKQKEDQLQRLDETKRVEQESRQGKRDERDRKKHEKELKEAEEAEIRSKKRSERIAQSAQYRETMQNLIRQKGEEYEKKVKEVKERRAAHEDHPQQRSLQDALPAAPEQQAASRLSKLKANLAASGKVFLEQYRKDFGSAKDINRSRLRPIVTRLSSARNMQRTPLHDMLTSPWTDLDHKFLRYSDAFGVVSGILLEAHASKDHATVRLALQVLHTAVADKVEGGAHLDFIARMGYFTAIVEVLHDEVYVLKRRSDMSPLTDAFMMLDCLAQYVLGDKAGAAVRETFMDVLQAAHVGDVCFAVVATVSPTDADAHSAQCVVCALRILLAQLLAISHRKEEDCYTSWLHRLVETMFTVLSDTLESSKKSDTQLLTPAATTIIFYALRVLSSIARLRVSLLQSIIKKSVNFETQHAFSNLLKYCSANQAELENLPPQKTNAAPGSSFADAMQFGVTADVASGKLVGTNHLRAALHELVLLIGYIVHNSEEMQDLFCCGKIPLINLLCALPVQYFALCRNVLFPTLVAVCYRHEANKKVLQREMSIAPLAQFLHEEWGFLSQAKREKVTSVVVPAVADPLAKPSKSPTKTSWADIVEEEEEKERQAAMDTGKPKAVVDTMRLMLGDVSPRVRKSMELSASVYFRVEKRFPIDLWQDAEGYFTE